MQQMHMVSLVISAVSVAMLVSSWHVGELSSGLYHQGGLKAARTSDSDTGSVETRVQSSPITCL